MDLTTASSRRRFEVAGAARYFAALISTDRRTTGALHDDRLRLNISRDIGLPHSELVHVRIKGVAVSFTADSLSRRATQLAARSMATIVASEYKERALLRVGVYGLATIVSASRFTGRNHFLSDFFVGSALGYGIGRVYNVRHSRGRSGDQGSRPNHSFFPSVIPRYESRSRTYGVTLAWKL